MRTAQFAELVVTSKLSVARKIEIIERLRSYDDFLQVIDVFRLLLS